LLEFGIYAAPQRAKNCLKAELQQGFHSTRSQMKGPSVLRTGVSRIAMQIIEK